MDIVSILSMTLLFTAIFVVGHMLYRAARTRFSPEYAVKRKVREEERFNRYQQKYRLRAAAREERQKKWAMEHPDDPFAKAFLTRKSALAPQGQEGDDKLDFAAELRRDQQEDDAYRQRREADKRAEEVRAQRLLDWAIANPTSQEARRHLEEQIEEVVKQLKFTAGDIHHCETMMSFMQEKDPELIMFATRLREAQAKKDSEEQLIRRMQSALEVSSPRSSTK